MAGAVNGKVPGHSDATYGPVPKEDQIFKVEFLDIAPTPIIADRTFFVYLRGYLPESKKKELGFPDKDLTDATLKVSGSAVYPDGERDETESVTIPFKTIGFNSYAHLVIRDDRGIQVDYLPSSGRGDVLLDFQIPTMFLESGTWTFSVDARAGDESNTCLFAMSVTQWLDGCMDRD
ncbi:hypothetical protein B0T10DRAFT_608969 [Thelonectria olida]|uniref:Uncharacterized protein n=1 Tax=Thelonectria olida TaxID=1576542 RepID=A0A9P9AM17_9HYPO|nr:hypothetical protein B0T10DRAFT_608969 [Thelonectria olida]